MRCLLLACVCLLLLSCGEEIIVNVVEDSTPDPVALSTPLFAAIGLVDQLETACTASEQVYCDGLFSETSAARFTISTVGDPELNDLYVIRVDPDGAGAQADKPCGYQNDGENSAMVEQQMIELINTANPPCDVAADVRAGQGSIIVERLNPAVTFSTQVFTGAGGNAGSLTYVEISSHDSDAFAVLFDFLVTPAAQEVVDCHRGMPSMQMEMTDCSDSQLELDPEADTEVENLTVAQAAGCANFAEGGAIRVDSQVSGRVDSAGILQAPYTLQEVVQFDNCRFSADFGIAGGSTDTSLILEGQVTRTSSLAAAPGPSTPDTVTLLGAIELTGDLDGNAVTTNDSIWTGILDFDLSRSDDAMNISHGGGACLGGALNVADDGCASTGTFVAADAWLP